MWTHALATVLSVAALVAMILVAEGDVYRVVSAAVFGSTLILLYGASTLYHLSSSPRTRSILQVLDHACIYLLIAGSYTPLTLVALRGTWGWSIFGVVWFLAIAGVVLKAVMRGKREAAWSTALYIVMGWLIVVAAQPLLGSMPMGGIAWLFAGGLCYTLGVIFFALQRMPFNHAVWHLFVIAGSACHVVTTMRYILA